MLKIVLNRLETKLNSLECIQHFKINFAYKCIAPENLMNRPLGKLPKPQFLYTTLSVVFTFVETVLISVIKIIIIII